MRRRDARKRGWQGAILLLLIAAALVILNQGVRWLEGREKKPETHGDYHQRYAYDNMIEAGGVSYRQRNDLTTILLMGVDKDETTKSGGYRSGGQADFLRLIVLDSARKSISQIQIDRDTMTPITILGVLGDYSGVRTSQISLAYGFGDGREKSCELTADAVSNLLLGTEIDFYAALSMDGIAALNDWAGGVTVTLEDDFSSLDPAMTAGTTLTLTGGQAEIFVRSRRSMAVGTNQARMKRQQRYIELLAKRLDEQMHESQETIGTLYDTLEPYLTTSLSRGRLINEIWAGKDYERSQPKELAGEYQVGSDGFMQFNADESSLEQTVLELLYEKVK